MTPVRRGRSVTLVLLTTLLALLALGLWVMLEAAPSLPLRVSIDGEPVVDGLVLASMSGGEKLATVAALLLALLTVMLVVPLALMMALGIALLVLLMTLGLPLVALLVVAAALLSPLLLIGWLLWRAMRPSPTIPA